MKVEVSSNDKLRGDVAKSSSRVANSERKIGLDDEGGR